MSTEPFWWRSEGAEPEIMSPEEWKSFDKIKAQLIGDRHFFEGQSKTWRPWKLPSPALPLDEEVQTILPACHRPTLAAKGIPCPFWKVREDVLLARLRGETVRYTNGWSRTAGEAKELEKDAAAIEAVAERARALMNDVRALQEHRQGRVLMMMHHLSDEGRRPPVTPVSLANITETLTTFAEQLRALDKEADALRDARRNVKGEAPDWRLSSFVYDMGLTWAELTTLPADQSGHFVRFVSVAAEAAGIVTDELSPVTVGRYLQRHKENRPFFGPVSS